MPHIEPQEDVDYDDVFESILNDAQSRGLSDDQVWEVWQTGLKQEYNDALEWVAEWITGAQMLGHSAEVIEYAQNMAMSIRAAKRQTLLAPDGGDVLQNYDPAPDIERVSKQGYYNPTTGKA